MILYTSKCQIYVLKNDTGSPQTLSSLYSLKSLPHLPPSPSTSHPTSSFLVAFVKLPSEGTYAKRGDVTFCKETTEIIAVKKQRYGYEKSVCLGYSDFRGFLSQNGQQLTFGKRSNPPTICDWSDECSSENSRLSTLLKSVKGAVFVEAKEDVTVEKGGEVLLVLPSVDPGYFRNKEGRAIEGYEVASYFRMIDNMSERPDALCRTEISRAWSFKQIHDALAKCITSAGGKKLEAMKEYFDGRFGTLHSEKQDGAPGAARSHVLPTFEANNIAKEQTVLNAEEEKCSEDLPEHDSNVSWLGSGEMVKEQELGLGAGYKEMKRVVGDSDDEYFFDDETDDDYVERAVGEKSKNLHKLGDITTYMTPIEMIDEDHNVDMEKEMTADATLQIEDLIGAFESNFLDNNSNSNSNNDGNYVDELLNDEDFVEFMGFESVFDEEEVKTRLGLVDDNDDDDEEGAQGKKKSKIPTKKKPKTPLPTQVQPTQKSWYTATTKSNVFAPQEYVHDVTPPPGNRPNGAGADDDDLELELDLAESAEDLIADKNAQIASIKARLQRLKEGFEKFVPERKSVRKPKSGSEFFHDWKSRQTAAGKSMTKKEITSEFHSLGYMETAKYHQLSRDDKIREISDIAKKKAEHLVMLEAQIVKLTKEALDIAEDEKNGIQPKPKPQAKVKAKAKAPAKKKKKAAISFDDLLSDDDDDVDDNDDDDDDDDEIAETKRKPNPSRGARASGTKMTSIMKACMSFDSDDEDSDSDIDAWSAGGSSSGNGIGKKMAGGKRSRSNTPEPVAEPVVVAAVPATTTAISVSAAIGAAAAAIGGAAAAAAAAAAAGLTAAGKTMTNKRSRSNTPEPVVIPPTPTPATPPTKTATTAKSPFQVGDVVFVNKTTHDRHTAKVLERPEEGGTVKVRWELRGGEEVVDVGKCEILNLTEGRTKRKRGNTYKK